MLTGISDRALALPSPQSCSSPFFAGAIPGPSSPAWHRRGRLRRAKARRRLHGCRHAALRPWARDLALLQRHHSRPVLKEFMGPKNQWQGAPWKHKDKSGGSDSSNSWSYWSGAWKAKGQDWRRNQSTDGTLVGYSNMEVPTVGHSTVSIPAATVQGLHAGDAVDGDFLKLVQKHLNSNRRLEGRLRKLQEDAQKKQAQWKAFESHMRDFFLQEKVKFRKDLEGITRETGDLEQQKRKALQALLHVLDNKHPQDMETEPTGAMRPADAAWDEVCLGGKCACTAGAGRC